MSDYTRIYLQPECCADEDTGRLWCQDDAPQSCPDGEQWTPYILKSEYDRLQAENEALLLANRDAVAWEAACKADLDRALARVAELEAVVSGVKRIAEAEPKDTAILRLIGARIPAEAWLLRQKAEAVEEAASCFGGRDYAEVRLGLSEQAQRLRTQADALERQSEGGD